MPTQQLDEKFWSRFAKSSWERKPVVIQNIQSDLLQLSEAEVFELVVQAATKARKEKSTLGFKFFVDGIRSSDYETMYVLPKRSDKSFAGYHERMERVYQDYCLVCDDLLNVKDKKSPVAKFTREIYKHVGLSKQFAEMGLYLGNYRKTPFGVHVDPCGVLSFPVRGIKKFRTWTSSYARKNPDLEQSFRYAKHKPSSKLLVAKPGDMAYWPSSAWHIAESNGSFSATWSLGIWLDRTTSPKESK